MQEKDDPTMYAWYFETVRFIFFACIAFFDWKLLITPRSLFLFMLLGITELIASYWLMKMHSYSHLSISSIVSRTRLIWVAVLGFIFIGESVKVSEYIGMIVLFIGLAITVAPKRIVSDKGIRYAHLDAFMIALNVVITKLALPFGSNSVINAIIAAPSVGIFPLIMKHTKKRLGSMFHKNFLLKTCAIVVNVLSVYLFTQALRIGDASKVTAVYQGMMILSVLAGIIILKERKEVKRKLIGAGITLIGVYLLNVL